MAKGNRRMSMKRALAGGTIIAICVMSVRFFIALTFNWPAYSWPEIGCLFLFTEVLGLPESTLIHFLAPLTCYSLVGTAIGGIAWLIPPVKKMQPAKFLIILTAILTILILVPIMVFQMNGWI